jgi:soluble lytic murein transglycosylase
VSPTGALGLAQFLRGTWADVARMLGEPPADPFDPESAIRYAARYLAWLLERCGAFAGLERVACALTAYNGGIGYTLRGWTYAASTCTGNRGLKSRLSLPAMSLRRHW